MVIVYENTEQDSSEENFQFYRFTYERPDRPQSLEAEGIFDKSAFAATLADPRTTTLEVHNNQGLWTVPLLTPLENVEWFNRDYHQRHVGPDRPLLYYGHNSLLYGQDPQGYLEALRPDMAQLAHKMGVLALDYHDGVAAVTEREVSAIASELAITLTAIKGPEGEITPHYHYASRSTHSTKESDLPWGPTIYEAYGAAKKQGLFKNEPVIVTSELTADEIERAWDFYEPAFSELTHDDPVQAGFSHSEFSELMRAPECIKFLYKRGQDIVNLCLQMDVRDCSWLNQEYYKRQYPEEYGEGLIACSPGIVVNKKFGETSTSLHTFGMVAKLMRATRRESVITFACDTESNKQVPRLSQLCFKRAGMVTDFSQPVGKQLFRMYSVS